MKLPRADRLHGVLAGEQPTVAMQHALLVPILPPLPQQRQQAGGEHGIAVLSALTALDPDQHPLAVDIAHLEHRHLGDAQARAIGDRQRRLMLEAGGGVEQPRHLVAAQHYRQLAGMAHPHQPSREVRPIERVGEEEPQGGNDAVHGRHRHAGLALLDLEPAQVLCRRRVGRAPEEGGEAPDVTHIVALRLAAEAPHVHVVDQAPAQRADGGNGNEFVHRSTPHVEGAEMLCPHRAALNPRTTLAALPEPHRQRPSRAAGSFTGKFQTSPAPQEAVANRPQLPRR